MGRKIGWVVVLTVAAVVVRYAIGGIEVLQRASHLERVCAARWTADGPKPGYEVGVWTHRVPGLGRKDPRAAKPGVCAAHGFSQP